MRLPFQSADSTAGPIGCLRLLYLMHAGCPCASVGHGRRRQPARAVARCRMRHQFLRKLL
jgi:hypothetical protein